MKVGFDAQLARRLATAEGEIARLKEELTNVLAQRDALDEELTATRQALNGREGKADDRS